MNPFGLRMPSVTPGNGHPVAPSGAATGVGATQRLQQDPLRTLSALLHRFDGQPAGLQRAATGLANKIDGTSNPHGQTLSFLLGLVSQAIQQGQLGALQQGMGPQGGMSYFGAVLPQTSPFAANPRSFNARNALPISAPGGDLQNLLNQDPAAFRDLVGGWAQTQEGNCSAVAMIKAGMDRHGNRLFDSVTPHGDGVRVRMKDGVEVSLTGQELAQARMAANFSGPQNGVKTYAEVAYAAMAKRAQLEGHEGAQTFPQALYALANGDDPINSARFLGLKNNIRPVDPRTLSGQDSVVGWNGRHALFIDRTSMGHIADSYGRPYAFDGTDSRGGPLQVAIAVV